ncbi:Inner membrane protein YdcZ [compost metagenome]
MDQFFSQQISWWKFSGGAMGALFVFGSIVLAPRIGMAGMISLIIAGQIFSSLIFDKFGLLGLAIREISWARIIGALLVIIGVVLVNFSDQLFKSK